MSYNMREARKVLYGLKRKLGRKVKAITDNGVTHDHTTGTITTDYDAATLNNVIILTQSDIKSFVRDLAYISSNRNFTSGGLFEKGTRTLIIDGQEDFIPTQKTHFEFDDEKWKVSEIDTLLDSRGYLIKVIKIDGNAPVGDSL